MPILDPPRIRPARVLCVREMHVLIPYERRESVRNFYALVLRLPVWSPPRQIPGGWGAGRLECGVYFRFSHLPVHPDPMARRLVIVCDDLDRMAQRLTAHSVPFSRSRGIFWTDRNLTVHDPVGHRIEIRESRTL